MKNSKKFLAGMGICLALGGTILTGCAEADINSDDLNNLMNNANNYLLENQKYNSEYVRSELNTLLVRGLNNSINSTSFSCTMMEDYYVYGMSYREISREDGVEEQVSSPTPYSYTYKWTMDKENSTFKRYCKALYSDESYNWEEYDNMNTKTCEKTCYYHEGDLKTIGGGCHINEETKMESYTDVYGELIEICASDEMDGVDFVKYQDGDNVVYSCAFVGTYDNEEDVTYSLILTFNGDNIVSMERRAMVGNVFVLTTSYVFDYENTDITFDTTGYVETSQES